MAGREQHGPSLHPGRLARVAALCRGYVERGEMPMAAVRVALRGRVLLDERAGVRDVATGAPLRADDLFRLYSMTKPLTVVGALILYERGCYSLDDPVAAFLPGAVRPLPSFVAAL